MRGIFVTGTGTGVGKSVLAAAACAALAARDLRVAAFKPAVTGLDEPPPPGMATRSRAARRRRRRRADGRGGGALPLRARGVAPLRGRAGRRDRRAHATPGRGPAGRRGRRRAGLRGGGRPDGALDAGVSRARPGRGPGAAAWWWPRAPGSGPSTTHCSPSRRLGPPAWSVAGVVMTPWPGRPSPLEESNRADRGAPCGCAGERPGANLAGIAGRRRSEAAAGRLALGQPLSSADGHRARRGRPRPRTPTTGPSCWSSSRSARRGTSRSTRSTGSAWSCSGSS